MTPASQLVLHLLQGDTQTQINTLRDEGNTYFGKKDYPKALESYDKALKLTSTTHQDKPLLHANKAACHMMAKKYVNVLPFNQCLGSLYRVLVICASACAHYKITVTFCTSVSYCHLHSCIFACRYNQCLGTLYRVLVICASACAHYKITVSFCTSVLLSPAFMYFRM